MELPTHSVGHKSLRAAKPAKPLSASLHRSLTAAPAQFPPVPRLLSRLFSSIAPAPPSTAPGPLLDWTCVTTKRVQVGQAGGAASPVFAFGICTHSVRHIASQCSGVTDSAPERGLQQSIEQVPHGRNDSQRATKRPPERARVSPRRHVFQHHLFPGMEWRAQACLVG